MMEKVTNDSLIGFSGGGRFGGAVDHLDPSCGVGGWCVDPAGGRTLSTLSLRGHGEPLSSTLTLLDRPDVNVGGAARRQAGFLFGWSDFDPAALTNLLRLKGDAILDVVVEGVGVGLPWAIEPLRLSKLLECVAAAPSGDRRPALAAYHDVLDIWRSGLLDAVWYKERYGLTDGSPAGVLSHYLERGEALGYMPNFYFKPDFYRRAAGLEDHARALLAYIRADDPTRPTSLHFDGVWHSSRFPHAAQKTPLAAYLERRRTTGPHLWFDPQLYLARYPELADVLDPYEHFVRQGIGEGRFGASGFDPKDYARRQGLALGGQRLFEHFLAMNMLGRVKAPQPAAAPAAIEKTLAAAPDGVDWLDPAATAARLTASGLFDPTYYLEQYPDLVAEGVDPGLHFVIKGDVEGRNPNALFDAQWYAGKHLRAPPGAGHLRHYIEQGEAAGMKPHPCFDPRWYANAYGVELGDGRALSDYQRRKSTNTVAPNPYYSPAYYLEQNPDVAEADVDGFAHWFNWGIFENRKAAENFDASFVWRHYLNNDRSKNAFRVFMDVGLELGWSGVFRPQENSLHRAVKANCAAGPLFEDALPPFTGSTAVKAMAFYLPQFHAIPENDTWWGAGFTEWRNLPRGVPRFDGHYQPHVPRDLGFYELADSGMMRRQVKMARDAGIHGFTFYYYNFSGHRLLEKPLDAFCADAQIDFPFSLIWANENWTRRWDGMEKDVLIGQTYRDVDHDALVDDLAGYMTHRNYLRIGGRPLFGVYRADVIPDCRAVLANWRKRFRARHNLDPYITMAQTFGCDDPTAFGFDAAFEFPPHKLGSTLTEINSALDMWDHDFTGSVRSYDAAVELSLGEPTPTFPLIRCAFPMWDNDARKQGTGMIFHGATPQKFSGWLDGLVKYARAHPIEGESIVFINAWNEWCEGAHLEPDCHYGFAYLNAVTRAVAEGVAARASEKLLLVGHDAFPSGAQQLLLAIAQTFTQRFGSEVSFILMDGGELTTAYGKYGDVFVMAQSEDRWERLDRHVCALRCKGYGLALTNSAMSGASVETLAAQGLRVVSLIHELPTLIAQNYGEERYERIRDFSDVVVFPNAYVASEMTMAFGKPARSAVIRAQGLYKPIVPTADARQRLRADMNIPSNAHIVVNIGHGDLRKGVDVFVATARAVAAKAPGVHFVWVGSLHPDMSWHKRDIERQGLSNIHFLPFSKDVASYLAASDLFFLTSREDPFPSVVLEALAAGLPVLCFDWGGGHVELLRDDKLGVIVPYLDVDASARAIVEALRDPQHFSEDRRRYRKALIARDYNFIRYCANLGALLDPRRKLVSVIVPNYNYARYIGERLESIFSQSYPVFEIIVLDDASQDESAAEITAVAARRQRIIRLEVNPRNSGSVFRQWRKGLGIAQGEYVWIAEADDLSDPNFLRRLVERMQACPRSLLAFCDSTAIDAAGATLYENYKGYYAESGDRGLDRDGDFEADDFLRRFLTPRNLLLNASAIVWDARRLRGAFDALGEEAFRFLCAGDWRIYVEACRQGGVVHYVADCLNKHRRHDASVTHALKKPAHFDEIARIHDIILSGPARDEAMARDALAYRRTLAEAWSISA